jgi:SNF2-related domain
MSFAAVPFACAVFDELQKVKSPSSLLTRAAKTVNADFVVGLTGTPIENRLADLWCIMDIVSPGHLGDLRSFSEHYQADDHDALSRLHSLMLDGVPDEPAPMLRRMKATELDASRTLSLRNLPRATGRGEIRGQIRRLGQKPHFPRTRQSPIAGPVGPLDTPSLRTCNRRGGTTPMLFFGRLKRRCRR